MILPRRIMRKGDLFCEEDDPKQDMNFHGKGFILPDTEAERIGLKAYLDATGWGEHADPPKAPMAPIEPIREQPPEPDPMTEPESKAVDQDETEDKGVEGPGLHLQPESRRITRAR